MKYIINTIFCVHKFQGYCDIPETCICKTGWSGPNCDVCVPYWNCEGYCENEPWECICPEGKSGPDCKDDGDVGKHENLK